MSPETGPILVVIDMQPKFSACNDQRTLRNCLREIQKAMEANQRIFIVAYSDEGPVHQDISDLVDGYDRVSFIWKYSDDGSRDIIEYLKEFKRDSDNLSFTICGVNTDSCVKQTVLGLAFRRENATIRVVKDACNQPPGWRDRKPFERMQDYKNVTVV